LTKLDGYISIIKLFDMLAYLDIGDSLIESCHFTDYFNRFDHKTTGYKNAKIK